MEINKLWYVFQVKLADRSLLPGDVVKFSDVQKGTQKGFVCNVEVVASVNVLVANQNFHNVDCKELSPLQVFVKCVHISLKHMYRLCLLHKEIDSSNQNYQSFQHIDW